MFIRTLLPSRHIIFWCRKCRRETTGSSVHSGLALATNLPSLPRLLWNRQAMGVWAWLIRCVDMCDLFPLRGVLLASLVRSSNQKRPRGVPAPLIASWAYITQLKLMVDIAAALGHADDASRYQASAVKSGTLFVQAYYRQNPDDGTYTFSDGSLTGQAANALALELFPEDDAVYGGLLTAVQRVAAVAALHSFVVGANGHSVTGIIGQRALYPVLSATSTKPNAATGGSSGSQLALAMMTKTDAPSVGDEISQGATTLWEEYDGGGTHNHIMFGTFGAWYYNTLAGIQMKSPPDAGAGAGAGAGVDGSGKNDRATGTIRNHRTVAQVRSSWLQQLVLKPHVSCEYLAPATDLSSIAASFLSPVGTIRSAWEILSCPAPPPTPPAPPSPGPPPPPPPSPPGQVATCGLVLEKDKYQTNTTGELYLNCGAGKVIAHILFADFGVPNGDCKTGFTKGNASLCPGDRVGNAAPALEKACVGKQSCTVQVGVHLCGDPCLNVPKRLAANISCLPALPSPAPAVSLPAAPVPVTLKERASPRHFVWNVSIPVGSSADVYVPLLGADATKVTIAVDGCTGRIVPAAAPPVGGSSSGGARSRNAAQQSMETDRCQIWASGKYISGSVHGVSGTGSGGGAVVGDDSVRFSFASGDYSIVLTDAP